jgi:hypothetical protein
MKEFNDKAYDTRDEQGNVKLGAKNVTTNNMKRGFGSTTHGHLFGHYNYQASPYDNQRERDRTEKLKHKAKIMTPFSGASNPNATFTPHYQTYRLEGEPYKPVNEDTQYRSKTNGKWTYNNPNKKGLYGTFTEFPKYVEEGEKPKPAVVHDNVWKYSFLYLDPTSTALRRASSKPRPFHARFPATWL